MTAKRKFVAFRCNAETTEVHIPGNGNYGTLCGIDGDDPFAGQCPTPLPPNPYITCRDCEQLWKTCRRYTARDFYPARESAK